MAHQREAERVFGFVSGQSAGGIDHGFEFGAARQFFVFGGNSTGNFRQLLARRQFVFQHDEQFFKFNGDLNDWGQHDQDRSVLFARVDLMRRRLNDLR